MNTRLLVAVCVAVMLAVLVSGQPAQSAQAPQEVESVQGLAGPQGPASTTPAEMAAHRALLDQYCAGCHGQAARAAGADSAQRLTLDDFDLARVADEREVSETIVRKLRAGLMPPQNVRHPEPAALESLIVWMETELDQTADRLFVEI